MHEAGGLVLAQSPASAKFDSMPVSAIATGVVDLVVPPEDMPGVLLQQLAGSASRFEEVTPLEEGDLKRIFTLLQESHGIDFGYYKQATVGRRIQRRMMLRGYGSLSEYASHIAEDMTELNALYKDLLIGVTQFFRNPEAFTTLERVVVPAVLAGASPAAGLRVWVAGCATGEEVYSVAMILREQVLRMEHPVKVKIFATDVHRESLEFASAGLYSEASLENVSRARGNVFRPPWRSVSSRAGVATNGRFFPARPGQNAALHQAGSHHLPQPAHLFPAAVAEKSPLHVPFRPQDERRVVPWPSEKVGELENEFDAIDRAGKIYGKRRDVRLTPVGRLPEGLPLSSQHLIVPPTAHDGTC